MREKISIPPPSGFESFGPSQLFRFFFQLGRWTEEGFSSDFQTYTRGTLISSVTVNKWKNHDVIPTRYAGPLFKLIEDVFAPIVAADWIKAFETVWAAHVARDAAKPELKKSSSIEHPLSNAIVEQHGQWIRQLYAENLFGEDVSPKDLYIPLQLIERLEADIVLYDVEDLLSAFTETDGEADTPDCTLVSGIAGSGKSMLALHLAQALTQTKTLPIYLRGENFSEIDIDIDKPNQPVIDSFSARSFLKHFRASSRKVACLILDGISGISGGNQDVAQTLSNLRLEQNICQAHGKTLNVILLARPESIHFIQNSQTIRDARYLELLGMDGRSKDQVDDLTIGRDLRADWWNKHLVATNLKPDTTPPDFLCTEYNDFQEFGASPMWSYLICQTAIENETDRYLLAHEAVNKFTYSENPNIVYQNVVSYISSDQAGDSENMSTLQSIALMHWHQDRAQTIHENITKNKTSEKTHRPHLNALSELLSDGTKASRQRSKLAHFFGLGTPERGDQTTRIKVLNEELANYLVSTLIIDRFIDLIKTSDVSDHFDSALESWSNVSSRGSHNPVLADFCQKEVRQRYNSLSNLKWDTALTIIINRLNTRHYSTNSLEAASEISKSAGLLFFIWSCFNLERFRRLETPYKFSDNSTGFDFQTLRQIYQARQINLRKSSLIEPCDSQNSFLTPSMSALHLTAADLSQLNLGLGHIESFSCEKSNFAMTRWNHVKFDTSKFFNSTFQQAAFHGCRLHNSKLVSCLFQGAVIKNSTFTNCGMSSVFFSQCHFADVDFLSSIFEDVIFDRCVFANCSFESEIEHALITGVKFRYCTFLSMKQTLRRFSEDRLENCIVQAVSDFDDSLSNKVL